LNTKNGINFYILINKFTFYTFPDLPPLTNPVYIHNLEINGELYNNVYKVYRNFDPKDNNYIYYSISDGIIKVVFPSGETLSKIK
jgi:hypothetical protein